jgi:hypothetical protein
MDVISRLIGHKQDPVFEAAKDLLVQFRERLENRDKPIDLKLPVHKWVEIFPGDPRSPQMQCFEGGTRIIIRFPSNSTPYCDTITTKVKKCRVFFGTIYDMNNPENKFENGDEFKVYPWSPVVPYTKDLPALAYVELE